MLILRNTDRIPCKLGDITVWVSPLSWDQKIKLYKLNRIEGGKSSFNETKMLIETLRLSIKDVVGFKGEFSDGSEAKLSFDINGVIEDESLELLIRALGTVPVSSLSSAILTDALSMDIPGWDVDLSAVEDCSKKKT